MKILESVDSVRKFVRGAKKQDQSIAFVPTMGNLHAGHQSCIDRARELGDKTVVSIFVNPTQFGPTEDFESYPKTLAKDLECCRRWGCDAVFTPTTEAMYPNDQVVWVHPSSLANRLCGLTRKDHFRGVLTVVAKLFNIVEPDTTVFGQKDAQQAILIKQMIGQLNLPIGIELSPIVRQASGLAMSSRNSRLTADERTRACGIYKSLQAGRVVLEEGERDAAAVVNNVRQQLVREGIDSVEYVELLDAAGLEPVDPVEGRIIIAVAAKVGPSRLIDNLVLTIRPDGSVAEAPLF